ncbi:Integral membrane protein TerC family protein [Leptospira interrogans serovar Canicola]|nr:Integral membrane protein TerC family protein [Leptospira interrogans serovar Canicola]
MELLSLDKVVAILTLTLMEIVLGIDNIVFLSIVSGKLPKNKQNQARSIGLTLALGFRIALLFAVSWIASLTAPFFTIANFAISGRDLIMLGGGLFLIAKSTSEIHGKVEGLEEDHSKSKKEKISFWSVIVQLILLDIYFFRGFDRDRGWTFGPISSYGRSGYSFYDCYAYIFRNCQ